MATGRTARWYVLWALASLSLAGVLGDRLLDKTADRTVFLPGPMTHGHHSIELACGACHVEPFGGGPVLQEACMNCHGAELKRVDDSHPKSKFTDPRNADRVARLDAQHCVTCHVEHRLEITGPMGVTLPGDFCVTCHAKIGEERETHAGLGFDTCASGGCHNFHDNRALYEDFLLEHVGEPVLRPVPRLPARDFGSRWRTDHPKPPAIVPGHAGPAVVVKDWLETAHARAGVQCDDCHAAGNKPWSDALDHRACAGCHETQVEGFLASKHGMRLPQNLPPMTPALARLPMQTDAAPRELGCTSCHAAHRFDTRHAAAEACLGCHADSHSLAYKDSKHFGLWTAELAGDAPAETGLSCAGCHLPREREDTGDERRVHVAHNQNDFLRPNEKMIRPVCLHCHGLGFALDALADTDLVESNFQRLPAIHIESIDMALRRAEADRARRAGEIPTGRSH
ncbi:MAG: cytochrome c3 family protein [Nevskiales bacterium]|nr:cytochrome c3 family protein [Nevskiales bacterium]